MTHRKRIHVMAGFLISVSVSSAMAGHDHGDDVIVGRTGLGRIAFEFEPEIHELPPVSGLFNGWGASDPGFLSLEMDEPDEDFLMLEPGADIRYQVLLFDPALKGYRALSDLFENPGDEFPLGPPVFDAHPFWLIDSDDPGFDSGQSVWNATGRLIDLGSTGYLPSEPFTLSFTRVPEPASLGLLIATLPLIRRSRRS